MKSKGRLRKLRIFIAGGIVSLGVSSALAQSEERVLYSFQGGNDGAFPGGVLISDKLGNLYGTTNEGGSTACTPGWCGIVFRLSRPVRSGGAWAETVIYVFKGYAQNDGSAPSGGLLADSAGNMYGVTNYGGSGSCVLTGPTGCGTVFKLTPPIVEGETWSETVLYNFQGGSDGNLPIGQLAFDPAGNLYGVTEFGGGQGTTCDFFYGGNCGTVFELSPPETDGGQWTETILHSFAGETDGAVPNQGLNLDSRGAIYGTTSMGGNQLCDFGIGNVGCGVVFKLIPPKPEGRAWAEDLWRFNYGFEGGGPDSVTFNSDGVLFGAAASGGSALDGLIFQLASSAEGKLAESVLYNFTGSQDGDGPVGVTFDRSGKMYGTAFGGITGRGTVFRLSRTQSGNFWSFVLLHNFTGPADGHWPQDGLLFDKAGNMYGTTLGGGSGTSCTNGCGTVYQIHP
jgi:hypothetical protein